MKKVPFLFLLIVAFCFGSAQPLPPGFHDDLVVGNLSAPTALQGSPDGKLLFILEKGGAVKAFDGEETFTYLTLNVSTESERGLLGIALDPNYASNKFLYLYYTTNANSLNAPPTPKNRVSRFVVGATSINPASETILLDLIPSDAGNHNGGCLRFGADGKLYVSTGDGGSNHQLSQMLNSLAGKILRINSNGTIPSDNPYFNQAGRRGEIWCWGLRNPFRFNIKPNTSVLYIGEVGEVTWEEVDVSKRGANFGWPTTGDGSFNQSTFPTMTEPMYQYNHNGNSAAIIGGCFMRSPDFPAPYYGQYSFGDFELGQIGYLLLNGNDTVNKSGIFEGAPGPVDFFMGARGGLYYASLTEGSIRVIKYKADISQFAFSPTQTVGGKDVNLNIRLATIAPAIGRTIHLTSDHPDIVPVPASVTLPGGTIGNSFHIHVNPFQFKTVVTVTDNEAKLAVITVLPPSVTSFTLAQPSVPGGGTTTGNILLNGIAPSGGMPYTTSSSNPNVAKMVTPGKVPAGLDHVSPTVYTFPVSSNQNVVLSVTSGGVTKSATLQVTAEPTISRITAPSQIIGGAGGAGSVALTKAGTGTLTVFLSSDTSHIIVPSSMNIAAGQTSAPFEINTTPVSANVVGHITATLGNQTRVATVTVTPN